jgi:hypothetical protein
VPIEGKKMSDKTPRNKTTIALFVLAIVFVVAAIIIMLYRSGVFADITSTPTATSTCLLPEGCNSPVASPTATTVTKTSVPTTEVDYIFHKGFNAMGVTNANSAQKLTDAGLYLYRYDQINNAWPYYPAGGPLFSAEPFRGYYVYNPSDTKTIKLSSNLSYGPSWSLTSGWNMLYASSSQTLNSLKFKYNGQTLTASSLISSGIIDPDIYIIDNDQTSDTCIYFKLLAQIATKKTCIKVTSSIASGKTFWIRVLK